ncbi:hypothetical protein Q5P01_008517 [Channa striata]|uniref:Ig-like domain-containing protein n=1 Tax=Channa striata TaxID=64152 RepID=A0AA88N472_CHASR|nr:hypothetical protein Q5P01_008517 [Channa striata]
MILIYCLVLIFTFVHDQHILTKSVHVGQDVTLKCSRHSSDSGTLYWIKLATGNFPETPRITAKQGPGTFDLHISKIELSDAAFYYCEKYVELKRTFLNVTFLRVEESAFNITATIQNVSSDPVRPGASVTLQCSVVSENRLCPVDHSVYWFRARSDQSQPVLIYAHGKDGDECEKSSEAHFSQKCIYSFTRNNVSSSDAGTYYCAVATCGQILFGNAANLNIDANMWCQRTKTVVFLLCVALTLTLAVIALLVYTRKKSQCDCFNEASAVQTNAATTTADQQSQHTNEELVVYSAPKFAKRKTGQNGRRGANAGDGTSIYADVRALGSDTLKSCVYRFSKTINASDAGIYYCAIAACGEVIFGNGTKLDIEGAILSSAPFGNITLLLLCAVLLITGIATAFFIYANNKNKCECCIADLSHQEKIAKRNFKISKDAHIYSAAVFTMMKHGTGGRRDAKAVDKERIYAAVKAFDLN